MDSDYGAQYRELFQRHWWWRAREHVILRALEAHRPTTGWSTVLDVGCGDGLFFDALAALPGVTRVDGVEPDATLVSADGRHRERITIAPFDARFAPGRRYSLVLMLDVLEHLPDPDAALRHAVSLLEPRGVLLVTVPAFMALWTRHDDLNHHFIRYTEGNLRPMMANAGAHVQEARYFFHWTAAAKLITRAVESLTSGAPKAPRVPWAPINGALYLLSRIEAALLGRARVPFGSSLLMVGRATADPIETPQSARDYG